jgi:hypothetical protein
MLLRFDPLRRFCLIAQSHSYRAGTRDDIESFVDVSICQNHFMIPVCLFVWLESWRKDF